MSNNKQAQDKQALDKSQAPSCGCGQDWRSQLDAETYRITREHGTEAPFSHPYNDNKQAGIYRCVCCQAELFDSNHKYDSGSGWPSFFQPVDGVQSQQLRTKGDYSLGYVRQELLCAHCDAHLGHVFDDGPQEQTGLRYCINGAALDFAQRDGNSDQASDEPCDGNKS